MPVDIAVCKVTLEDIWREIELPLTASLKDLHNAIQAAFGWLAPRYSPRG